MVRIIVAGSRDFHDYSLARRTVLQRVVGNYFTSEVEIISGTAHGADKLGERFAEQFSLKLTRMPAKWDEFGRRAGMIRNYHMAKYAASDNEKGICFCFWDGESKGTERMIEFAKKEGLEVHVVKYLEDAYEIFKDNHWILRQL